MINMTVQYSIFLFCQISCLVQQIDRHITLTNIK